MNRLFFLLIASFIFLTSCKDIKEVECTGIKDFKVHKVNTEEINSEIFVTIKNPNPFGFTIYKSEFDVLFSSIKLGQAKLDKKVKIGANKEETYPFLLKADLKGVSLSDVLKILESFSHKGVLEVKGDLKVGKLFVKKSFPVNVKEKISTF